MRYRMILAKEKTYWWDEDSCGSCEFNAPSDEQALSFAYTIARRMNRVYWRMHEPRGVFLDGLERLEARGFGDARIPLDISTPVPFQGFRTVRRALEAFFPKDSRGRRDSLMRMFEEFRPISRHSRVERRATNVA